MGCKYCLRYTGHHPQCPNYEPPKAKYCCSMCGEGICENDKYVEGEGEYIHVGCFENIEDFADWYGCDIKTMGCDYFEEDDDY